MIIPALCTTQTHVLDTRNEHQLRPHSVTQPSIVKYVLDGVILTERKLDMHKQSRMPTLVFV